MIAFDFAKMRTGKAIQATATERALRALKQAVLDGAAHQYARLIDAATTAGATDDDIDRIAHEAMELLLQSAEQPLTPRSLSHLVPAGRFD